MHSQGSNTGLVVNLREKMATIITKGDAVLRNLPAVWHVFVVGDGMGIKRNKCPARKTRMMLFVVVATLTTSTGPGLPHHRQRSQSRPKTAGRNANVSPGVILKSLSGEGIWLSDVNHASAG